MFVNFSNHPSDLWTEEQTAAARQFGEIVDVPFPAVPAEIDEDGIELLASEQYDRIMRYDPNVVMCQGEFTLSYAVINLLLENGIRTVAACSNRMTIERGDQKLSRYKFIRFRDYCKDRKKEGD